MASDRFGASPGIYGFVDVHVRLLAIWMITIPSCLGVREKIPRWCSVQVLSERIGARSGIAPSVLWRRLSPELSAKKVGIRSLGNERFWQRSPVQTGGHKRVLQGCSDSEGRAGKPWVLQLQKSHKIDLLSVAMMAQPARENLSSDRAYAA